MTTLIAAPVTRNTDAERLFFEGNAHLAASDHVRATACFRGAVALAPLLAEAHANLGWVLAEDGAVVEAEALYRRALALSSTHIEIRLNYGAFLARMKKFMAAQRVYLGAIDVDPNNAPVYSNLGALYAQVGRFDDAEICCRKSMALDPSYPKAHINLAYLLLRTGRFEEGLAHFEWRHWQADLAPRVTFPRWAGESLTGRSILVAHEAGHGDAIQFSRYASNLKAHGARRVTMMCPPSLIALFASLAGVDDVLGIDDTLPTSGWDYWTSSMSLPHVFETRLETIPAALPYLQATASSIALWRRTLEAVASMRPVPAHREATASSTTARAAPWTGPLVGVVWRGNPNFDNDADRSIGSLADLRALLDTPGATFVSLQKEMSPNDIGALDAMSQVIDIGADLTNFADTAAVIENLDLVITVDTAVAHLAGALGKPCWVLLPHHMTDWRWLADRSDSPWYPGVMRLFRQQHAGDWRAVLDEVGQALRVRLAR